MGIPQSPQEAAPAYDDVFNNHPVNRFTPSGSASAVSHSLNMPLFNFVSSYGY
jgi:hypothetical protein